MALGANSPHSNNDHRQNDKPYSGGCSSNPSKVLQDCGKLKISQCMESRKPTSDEARIRDATLEWIVNYRWNSSSWKWSDHWCGCFFFSSMDCQSLFWGLCMPGLPLCIGKFMVSLWAKAGIFYRYKHCSTCKFFLCFPWSLLLQLLIVFNSCYFKFFIYIPFILLEQ